MKGLLYNNLITMKRDNTFWFIGIFTAFVFAVSFWDADVRLFCLTVYTFVSVIILAKNGGMNIAALPFSKAQIVADRYVWSLAGVALALIVGSISTAIRYWFVDSFSMQEVYLSFFALGLALFSAAVCVFVSFFKPTVAVFIQAFFTGAFSGICYNQSTGDDGSKIYTLGDKDIAIIMLSIAVVIFALSWFASYFTYKKRGVRV